MGLLDAVPQHLAAMHVWPAVAALALHLTNHLLRSVAWRNVLAAAHPDRDVRLPRVAAAYASGVAANAVVPGRGGDAIKIGLVRAGMPGSSVATIAATMSVLVVFDLLAATALLVVIGLAGVVPLHASPVSLTPVHAAVAGGILLVVAGLLATRVRGKVRALASKIAAGGAILRTPGRYARQVAVVQAAAWGCRIGVVFFLLAAFGLPASVPVAALVMVLTGASTIVPLTPGGAGTQQVLIGLALRGTASAAAVLSFSVGMQVGVTAVNALIGIVAAMVLGRSMHPLRSFRSMLAGARAAEAPATAPASA